MCDSYKRVFPLKILEWLTDLNRPTIIRIFIHICTPANMGGAKEKDIVNGNCNTNTPLENSTTLITSFKVNVTLLTLKKI